MSLYLNFEPHSWYKGWAIQDRRLEASGVESEWEAVTDNGMTGYIDTLEAGTLKELKERINARIDTLAERDRYNRQRLGEVI